MSASKGTPVRFSWLTALIWLLVAAGIIFLLWQVIRRISPQNIPLSSPTPNQTQVYQTIAAVLTAQPSASVTSIPPSATPSPTPSLSPVTVTGLPSAQNTSTPGETIESQTPLPRCDQVAAGNPIDITIPDNSLVDAGQGFTKTWKLVNIGTCTWTTDYSARFFYGERMGAPESVPLQATVLPGQSVEISVDMVAPLAPGPYQGNWKLSNDNGDLFGIGPNGDAPFWVRIIVPQSQLETATATVEFITPANPTEFTTPSVTPTGQVSGELSLVPGDTIDLDTLLVNSDQGDLLYKVDADEYHWLIPQASAAIGVYGSLEPTQEDCQSAGMSSAPVAVESLTAGSYLCYLNNQGRYGRALLEAVDQDDFTLTLYLVTWGTP